MERHSPHITRPMMKSISGQMLPWYNLQNQRTLTDLSVTALPAFSARLHSFLQSAMPCVACLCRRFQCGCLSEWHGSLVLTEKTSNWNKIRGCVSRSNVSSSRAVVIFLIWQFSLKNRTAWVTGYKWVRGFTVIHSQSHAVCKKPFELNYLSLMEESAQPPILFTATLSHHLTGSFTDSCVIVFIHIVL